MTDLAKHGRADEGVVMPGQKLSERWTIEYERRDLKGKIEARLSWPHPTHYLLCGEGDTIREARLNLVLRLATAIAQDEDPYLTSPEAREGFALAAEAARAGLDAASSREEPS